MPLPSIFPPIAALGLMLSLGGFLLIPADQIPAFPPSWLSIVGLLILAYGVWGWALEPPA
jgi:hypothetical protein